MPTKPIAFGRWLCSCLLLATLGCGHREMAGGGSTAKAPAEATYRIVEDSEQFGASGQRRDVKVRVSGRVDEGTLKNFAAEIKAKEKKSYEATFIAYHLPELIAGLELAPWAATDFAPKLKVEILGFNPAEAATLAAGKPVGNGRRSWLVDATKERKTIVRDGAAWKLETTGASGASQVETIGDISSGAGTRFAKSGSRATYSIEAGGILKISDADGVIGVGEPL